jgi:hypothetical protein
MGDNNNGDPNYRPISAFEMKEREAKRSGTPASKRPQIIAALAGRTTPRAYYFASPFWTIFSVTKKQIHSEY